VLWLNLVAGHSSSVNSVARAHLQAGALQCASQGSFNKATVSHSWISNRASGNGDRVIRNFQAEIESTACTVDAEVTEGPYYVNNELQRSDIRDTEPGVPLILQFTIVDISNCSALPYASVELWHTNATGSYAHFTGVDPDTGSMTPSASCVDAAGYPVSSVSSAAAAFSNSDLNDFNRQREVYAPPPMPGGPRPPMSGGGPGAGGSTCMTDYLTFNRGWQVTNSEGVVQMTTNYPGFYTGRTPHIHLMIRTSDNAVRHIGQIFLNETRTSEVYAIGDYAAHISKVGDIWLRLANDGIYSGSEQTPINLVQLDDDDLSEGLVGAVTIYVDSSESQTIASTNYLTGGPQTSSTPSPSSPSSPSPAISPESSASSTTTVSAIFLGIMFGVLGVIFAQYVYAKYKARRRQELESFAATEAALKVKLEDDL
jgi:protocatechuate 3,4-dioxygenase beta subunit